jgi:hypothetical protein
MFSADVIIVVDNSDSMGEEVALTQQALNTFANIIEGASIDLQVILISDDTSNNNNGICVPIPLGTGVCPIDENLPGYRHVVHTVGSSAVFESILTTYDQWSNSLRPDATRAIVVVTDDNDNLSFTNFNANLLAVDPTFAGYRFHAIVASDFVPGDLCSPFPFPLGTPPGPGQAPGTEYLQLVALTGGVAGDLCDLDFDPVFDVIAQAIIADTEEEIPPTASDDTATTSANLPVDVDVAANDTDANDNLDPSSAVLVSGPANGVVDNNNNGVFTYTPNTNVVGADVFTYEICDTTYPVPLCDSANVIVTVVQTTSACDSEAASVDQLQAQVDVLTTSQQSINALTRSLENAQSALDKDNNKSVRARLVNFLSKVVNRSNLKTANRNRIPLDEANDLICGGANVLIGISPP